MFFQCSAEPCLLINGVRALGNLDNYQELLVHALLAEQSLVQFKVWLDKALS